MASFVTLTTLDGEQIDINAFDDTIADLRAVPSSVLGPLGLANGTYIEWTSGRKIGVQGTLAATAAALTAASYVTPAQLAAAIAALNLASGVYAPALGTFTGTISAVTAPSGLTYSRVGEVVTFGGVISVTSSGAGAGSFRVSLPVATTVGVGGGMLVPSQSSAALGPTATVSPLGTSEALVSMLPTGAVGPLSCRLLVQYRVA